MHRQPAISVIMSVYNGGKYLYSAMQSIIVQDFADFEFIIVNDGSTDNSIDILNHFARSDPRVRIIDRANKGLIVSLNELVMAARAPYLARMDADDAAMPRRLGLQFAFLEANPDVGVLGTNTHELDSDGRIIECRDFYPDDNDGVLALLQLRPALCHPSAMMRTQLVRTIGGYRKAFAHAEDYDLWLRMSRQTTIRNLPERLLLYRRSEGQVSQRYAIQQSLSARIARITHDYVLAGHNDPFDNLDALPPLESLDQIFGQPGLAAETNKWLVEQSLYTDDVLHGPAFPAVLEQARLKDGFTGAWRTVLRLLVAGQPVRAGALGRTLIFKR